MKSFNIRILLITLVIFSGLSIVRAQTETMTNQDVIALSKSKLDKSLIVQKIKVSNTAFDVSVNGLIELKDTGVDDEIIRAMMERSAKSAAPLTGEQSILTDDSATRTTNPAVVSKPIANFADPKAVLLAAKTIAIDKSSLSPSRQSLEKELLKRDDWKKFNLNIVRYKEGADLHIEIGRVPFSWVTHRYVFRIYDSKSGTVIAAGDTTSWGSLAKNLAKDISEKLGKVSL